MMEAEKKHGLKLGNEDTVEKRFISDARSVKYNEIAELTYDLSNLERKSATRVLSIDPRSKFAKMSDKLILENLSGKFTDLFH